MNSKDSYEWHWPAPHQTDQRELEYLKYALSENDWSHTELCESFENKFAAFLGVRHALLVPSGTAAIYLTLVAAGIRSGQEVIVPGITWPSVVYAILLSGGIPRTVDIDAGSLCISTQTVEGAINESTFAVLATHLFGSQCDMAELSHLAQRYRIHIIEDAAQTVGSVQNGKSCGTWGLAGTFSLNDKKILACGEGGCIVTDSDDLDAQMRMLQLILPERGTIPRFLPGTYKISEFQAAIALGQLEKLDERLKLMQVNADRLTEKLLDMAPTITRQLQPLGVTRQSYYNYCFHVEGRRSPRFREELSKNLGLKVSRTYVPLCDVTDFRPSIGALTDAAIGALAVRHPNCQAAYEERSLRLPHFVLLSDAEAVDRLAETIMRTQMATSESLE